MKYLHDGWYKTREQFARAVFFLALPFFVLYWLIPFVGNYTIGNDYLGYWIQQQQYLQFSVLKGTFPLYAPGFAGGWTASALSFGQLWHPISWIAAHLPGYWNGYALQIGTLLRLFSLGGVHLVLFLFLKRLRLNRTPAFVISFITVYNLRMLDMFRYGASLENYIAHLLLCTAVGWHYLTPTKRWGPLAIAVSTYLLIVGGHPQIMYFGLLGAAVVCLAVPFYAAHMLPEEISSKNRRLRSYYCSVALSVAVGFLLALPYILPYYFEYISDSSRGLGMDFRWACDYQDTVGGHLSNLFSPFNSDVHGAFGGSALILPALLVPLLLFLRIRVGWSVLYIWIVYVITFVLMLGSNGPLYYYFWKYFPLAQNFRTPGRLGLLLPFMTLLLLAWLARRESPGLRIRGRNVHISPLALLAAIALVLFVVFDVFDGSFLEFQGAYSPYSPAKLNNVPTMVGALTIAFGLAGLVALTLFNSSRFFGKVAAVVLVAAVLLQVTATLRYGTWLVAGQIKTPTSEEMINKQRQRFGYSHKAGAGEGSIAVTQCLKHTFAEPSLARLCREYTTVASQQEAYSRLARERSIDHIFLESYPQDRAKVDPPPRDNSNVESVELKYNSFNKLTFDVTCTQPAFFVFSFPWSRHWLAQVGGKAVTIYRANGIEQAIRLPAGKSTVQLRYWSWPSLVGVTISCITLLSAALYLLTALRRGPLRRFAVPIAVCLFALGLLIWYRSLYWGGNIGTNYTWSSEDIRPNLSSRYNLAYGKTTAMSQWYFGYYSQASPLGVDGQREPERGFTTVSSERAWWQVDLGRVEPIGQIILYKQQGKGRQCDLPFDVIASADGKRGMLVGTVSENTAGASWRIRLGNNLSARYIRLQTRQRGRLRLAEVEIYAPKSFGHENLSR